MSFAMSALVTALTARHEPSRSRRAGCSAKLSSRAHKRHVLTSNRPRLRNSTTRHAYAPERTGSVDETEEDLGLSDVSNVSTTNQTTPKPLLCFVNGKSGGQRGEALMSNLAAKKDLNLLEIVDLTVDGPTPSLKRHVGKDKDLIVLVCGGDGTVAWVLQAMEELGEAVPKPPVGILPLGTGNDLARVFGWGARYDDRLLDRLATALEEATPRALDRWDVRVERARESGEESGEESREEALNGADRQNAPTQPTEDTTTSNQSATKTITLHNYLGVGVDAKAALAFHDAREFHPYFFVSSITNKALYGLFGAIDAITHSCRDLLRDHVTIVADGKKIKIPRNAEGVILLNLNSYAGGARMWDAGEQGTHRKNFIGAIMSGGLGDTQEEELIQDSMSKQSQQPSKKRKKKKSRFSFGKSKRDDGLVDVVAVYGALHLGQLSFGTDRPVRLCQAKEVSIAVTTSFPIQIDGQPWEEEDGAVLNISRKDSVSLLSVDPVLNVAKGSSRGYNPDDFDFDFSKTFMGFGEWEELEYYDDVVTGAGFSRF